MAWIDLTGVQLENPGVMPWLGLTLLIGLAVLLLPWRHAKASVAVAGGLRCLLVFVLVFALAGFTVVSEQESRFEPAGTWALVLPGGQSLFSAVEKTGSVPFEETPDAFANRVRNSIEEGKPPAQAVVYGPRDNARATRDAVLALGVPCRAIYEDETQADGPPVLTAIRAPRVVKPGEAFKAEFDFAGTGGALHATLDGEVLRLTDGGIELRLHKTGRHVLEVDLKDGTGAVIQRAGHVFTVGEWPRVLAIGVDDKQLKRAAEMLPDMRITGVGIEGFGEASLRVGDVPVELALASVDALSRLSEDQASTLAMFVARGGGLLVTGDGAKYVTPEYLPRDARNLLPVLLQKEGKKPPEVDPKLEEQPIKAEVAKVSMCFVLDRSYSMSNRIGRSPSTRWQVATKGVTESLALVDQGGRRDADDKSSQAWATRVGVMVFNLQQDWVFSMNPALPFARKQIGIDLDVLGEEISQLNPADFDAQGYNTDIYAAMSAAIDAMESEKSAVKVIVMLTDGADRDANTKAGLRHAALRERAIAANINVIAIGIGDDFDSSSIEGKAARRVVEELATRPEFVNIASDEETAIKANVIFVESVETAFQAYDDKKKQEEEDRKRKLEENKEEPKVDVLPGTMPLALGPIGEQLFGRDVLPTPGPKVGWVARNLARSGAAVALLTETPEANVPVLALSGYGLGRVGFWGAGTDPEALGEVAGWAEFPGLFAGTMRWLTPREEPDVRLLAEAAPEGVRILDPLPHATYVLRTAKGDVALTLKDDVLVGDAALPLGPGEVIERVDGSEGALERSIGDVYVAIMPDVAGVQVAVDQAIELPALAPRAPELTESNREATLPLLYLLVLALLVLPFERLVRRRS